MPLVSVIIPTYNRAALLREAIESVLAVDRRGFELEVIVVDDGSTDETSDVVAALPVTYLRTTGNEGASAARNRGLRAARGEYIAFLDDDDVWLPNNIAPQLAILHDHPEYAAAHAQVILTDPTRKPFGEPVPAGPLVSGWIFEELLSYWPQLAAVVVRATVVREIGLFDPNLRSEEEWDWLLRIAQRYQIGRVEEPVAFFRQRGSGDEDQAWQRLPDTLRVFRRYTRASSQRAGIAQRLRMERRYWAHRGWFAANFFHYAQRYSHHGDRLRALRCLRYAVQTSPMHTAALVATSWRPKT